jgi:hypothetical protein
VLISKIFLKNKKNYFYVFPGKNHFKPLHKVEVDVTSQPYQNQVDFLK